MLKLFGKKKEAPAGPGEKQSAQTKHPELAALAAKFGQEEFEIMAVTGPNGFGGGKAPGQDLWLATLPITAWREGDGPIHQGDARLIALADDTLLDYLRRLAPRDSIIQAKVRQGLEDDRFLLVGMPALVTEPELKAILEEQTRPLSTWIDGLGTFVLDRRVNWFKAEVDWLGCGIRLSFDRDENQADCIQAARALMSDQAGWDAKVRACAADKLLSLANDWAQDGTEEDEEPEEVTREGFMERMELESIQVFEDDSFDFWFGDGELFGGHGIRVSGTLAEGPTDAQMEG